VQLSFSEVQASDAPRELVAWGIDSPRGGDRLDGYSFEVRGWALGRRLPVVACELVHDETVLWRAPLDERRPDVEERLGADKQPGSGFSTRVTALALPLEIELLVRFVLEDKTRIPTGVLRGVRRPVATSYAPALAPLIVTTIGRSGSTAIVDVLSRHPEVVVYRPRETEARAAAYWAGVLRELAEPESYLRQLDPGGDGGDPWWLRGQNPTVDEILARRSWLRPSGMERDGGARPAAELLRRLDVDAASALASFAQRRVDALYRFEAERQERPRARFFAEKLVPNFVPDVIWELYPESRELILVRDFRDLVASIFAYNEKRGFAGFGRDSADSDLHYVLTTERRSVAALARSWKRRSGMAHLVRYEDLVTRPRETVEALAGYAGLEGNHEAMLAPLLPTREMEAHRTSASAERSIGRWREDLSPALQEACLEAFGEALDAFGYTSDDAAPS
jgi:hypothetical protein